jgi:hypothetical protein
MAPLPSAAEVLKVFFEIYCYWSIVGVAFQL